MGNTSKYIKDLYDQELYTNAIKVCNVVLTTAEEKPETIKYHTKLEITYYYADSLYHTQQYFLAERQFNKCLQLRKLISKIKSVSKAGEKNAEIPSDVDIKYKIHLCYLGVGDTKSASDILQSINTRQRNAKVNMALGKLLQDSGLERNAIACYKDVLQECPLALEAAENLLKLGVKGIEVNSLMVEASNEFNWLNMWLKAQAQLHSRDFKSAIETYKNMDIHGILRDNVYLLVNMGYCFHYMCDERNAISVLQRAYNLEPELSFGLDLLSSILVQTDDPEDRCYLETLISKKDMSVWTKEQWVVLGNYMCAVHNFDRAVYFGQQACHMDNSPNIEGLLVKINGLFHLSRYQEAAAHCTEALQACPIRFDIHKYLVECYIKMNRLREADSMAIKACKQLNYSSHALKLHAMVLLKDPTNDGKNVKRVLERAITQDKEGSTSAVTMLASFLVQEQQYEQAKLLLLKQIEFHPSSKIHQLLADCYVSLQKDEDAFDHYNIALKMDPNNQKALEGLNSIGPSQPISKRESYYTCVGDSSFTSQDTAASEPEPDVESDTELWPHTSEMISSE